MLQRHRAGPEMCCLSGQNFILSAKLGVNTSSQEVAEAASDGTCLMIQAVDDMNKVKATLDNIYNLAQNIRNEYNV